MDTPIDGGMLKLALLHMADRANYKTGLAWPSMADTAARCGGISPRQARAWIGELITQGYLEVIGSRSGGRGTSTRYRIKLEKLAAPRGAANAEGNFLDSNTETRKDSDGNAEDIRTKAEVFSTKAEADFRRTTQEPPQEFAKEFMGVVLGVGIGQGAGIGLKAAPPQAASLGVAAPNGIAPATWAQIADRKARPFTAPQLATLAAQVGSAIAAGESVRGVEARLASLLTPERGHWVSLPRAEAPADRATPSPTAKKRAAGRKTATAAPISNPDTRASGQDWTYDPSKF